MNNEQREADPFSSGNVDCRRLGDAKLHVVTGVKPKPQNYSDRIYSVLREIFLKNHSRCFFG